MSIYKFIIIISLLANDLTLSSTYALTREKFKLFKNEKSKIYYGKNNLDVHYKRTIGVSKLREILIQDKVKLDILLSNIVSDSMQENKSEQRNSMEIVSDKTYEENGIFYAEGNVILTMKNGTLYTDKLIYHRANKIIKAEGNIEFYKGSQFFNASYLKYNFEKDKGFIDNIYGVLDFDKVDSDLNFFVANQKDNLLKKKIMILSIFRQKLVC